jgi:hypothetical protein
VITGPKLKAVGWTKLEEVDVKPNSIWKKSSGGLPHIDFSSESSLLEEYFVDLKQNRESERNLVSPSSGDDNKGKSVRFCSITMHGKHH